jgi:hypothetical protein
MECVAIALHDIPFGSSSILPLFFFSSSFISSCFLFLQSSSLAVSALIHAATFTTSSFCFPYYYSWSWFKPMDFSYWFSSSFCFPSYLLINFTLLCLHLFTLPLFFIEFLVALRCRCSLLFTNYGLCYVLSWFI